MAAQRDELGTAMNLSFSMQFAASQETDAEELTAQLLNVDRATGAVLNEWLMRRPAPVFRIGDIEYELRWIARADPRWHVAIELACGGHRAIVALDGLAALDPRLVGEPFVLMPAPLRDLGIQRLLARALSTAPPAIAESLDVLAVRWDLVRLPECPCQLSFSLTRRPEGTRLLGALLLENSATLQWLHSLLPIDKASEQKRLQLAAPLRLIVGRSIVASGQLAELDHGDVVWIQTADITRAGVEVDLLAPLAKRGWRCRAQRSTLRIVSAVDDAEAWVADAPGGAHQTSNQGEPVMSAERSLLETPVTFDLGEINMKIQDLERLQPGQVIDLPQDVSAATVALRIAGRRIAEGMLIAVGRRLGVRISRICVGREAD